MSMNLCFKVKDAPAYVDFPFQTPTNITFAVLRAKPKDRMNVLAEMTEGWGWDESYREEVMSHVYELMKSPTLELTYI